MPHSCPRAAILRPVVIALMAGFALRATAAETPPVQMLGFTAARAAAESVLEHQFDAQLSPTEQRDWLQKMSAEPNQVGSAHDKANAEFLLRLAQDWGWDAHIETFTALYPTPNHVALELVAPTRFVARLNEPPVDGDQTSTAGAAALPPYNIYGADGDVTGELVYANQGMPDDYKELARRGIDVKGRIVIARYGGGWRGLKPKLAYEHGAIGCIIYSDPRDDGYGAGDAYPKGGFRPADGVQRGSVEDMTIYPGDPQTPDVGSTADAKRQPLAQAQTILKIPVLPISYSDAQPLLAALDGPVVPADWRGALPFTYHFGPGPAKVHLTIRSDWSQKPVYDVIAMLRGRERPDEWVMRGNHHDGWVTGAWDPLSCHVAMMSEMKAISALAKTGWRPKRTLVYASWDAEEPGLIGSTEWAETHAEELRRKLVLYVNSDNNGRGFLRAEGSHGFQTLVNQVGDAVMDPETKATVAQRVRAWLQVDGSRPHATDEAKHLAKVVADHEGFPIGALGSGSDYSSFLQHLGIAAIDIRFQGEEHQDGVYHSLYDSFEHYLRFGDPGFVYGIAEAQVAGRVALRTAEADLLPIRARDFYDTVDNYVVELHKLEGDMREATAKQHRLLDEGAYTLAADPTETYRPPERDASVPFLNLAPLDNALVRLKTVAEAYDRAYDAALKTGQPVPAESAERLDALLRALEQQLLYADGLPKRPWYRHMIYAPGTKTGYGVKTLPGVREAIEDREWSTADQYAAIDGAVLGKYCDQLADATALLQAIAGSK